MAKAARLVSPADRACHCPEEMKDQVPYVPDNREGRENG